MSWRRALWEKVSLADGDVTVVDRMADTRYGAFDEPAPEPAKANRRVEPRYAAADVPAITSVQMLGQPVTLINISASGALVESNNRMKSGERAKLMFTGLSPSQVSGSVVRCVVASISAGGKLRYETGIAFSQHVNLPVDPAAVPLSTARPAAAPEAVPAAAPETTTALVKVTPKAMATVKPTPPPEPASEPAPAPAPVPAPTLALAPAPASAESSAPQLSPQLLKLLADASRPQPAVRNRW